MPKPSFDCRKVATKTPALGVGKVMVPVINFALCTVGALALKLVHLPR